jgi:hypothetical protein
MSIEHGYTSWKEQELADAMLAIERKEIEIALRQRPALAMTLPDPTSEIWRGQS